MSAPTAGRVLVVGGGTAASTFVSLLRQAGHQGEIVVVGAERHLPYHRPPLSKKFGDPLVGPDTWLREAGFYDEQGITMCLAETVTELDPKAFTVTTDLGRVLSYDTVVLATGARPRQLAVPGAHLRGVLSLRTLDDAELLREAVLAGSGMVVVGGGYVGLEVASVARSRGLPVSVLERENRLLARVASPTFGDVLESRHRERGTRILTGTEVIAIEGDQGRVRRVYLDDDSCVAADLVVVGVGAVPCDELASAAGIECGSAGGIVVDAGARTSAPGVLAIGDVTVRPRHGGPPMRLESIPSAMEQARQAVAMLTGAEPTTCEVPWFWSDQLDLKIKIAGIVEQPYETSLRGAPGGASIALLHHRDGIPVAVETANANADFMAARRMLASATPVDPRRWADRDVSLRELALA
ncbi:3-phenylpropionate/trans-cinnamate dioxygenase ferredoxin reductase subunit [Nocardioides sp. BE266]|uniref:NAD(P)/FAD-dependent oxidoreductase n=1 Tax=Nocardioides sp. BE266 TaxID=2817725 RepID=UPI002862A5B4|nr:FAD-dependent oxidoreductase [Nocardioides sp. BE266]MDR7254227.1 3-phenylpropionate/trans-cinnamate dioxygenase ferredoxin reductase subunit [Nocardioides sp. BE266]